MGHDLSADDLIEEFRLTLETVVFELSDKQDTQGGSLAPDELRHLTVCQKRLDNLDSVDGTNYARARLQHFCSFTEHNPSNVVPFTAAENDLICELSWQSWDYLIDILARASEQHLSVFVADPAGLIANRATISLNFQDAVPVYLDLSTGKILVRYAHLDERHKRSLRKRRAAKGETEELPEVESVTLPSDAVGAARREKNRLTFFCRQAIEGLFDPDQKMPTGHIKDSVLLVQAAKPARLEDMSHNEPAQWLRSHSMVLDGVVINRVRGEPVGALGADWRDARRTNRSLFYAVGTDWKSPPDEWKPGPVRVWYQEKATEDTIVAAELSDLIREENYLYLNGSRPPGCFIYEFAPEGASRHPNG